MQQNNVTSIRELLEQMPTTQLDEMLNAELGKEIPDANAVKLILDILKQREKDHPIEITPEIESAWKKYQQDSAKIRDGKRRVKIPSWVLRSASVAAVFVLILLTIPQQAQAESFWDRLVRMTSEIVEFFSPDDTESRLEEYTFRTDNPGLQQVYDAVTEMGVTVPVVPMWLLDGNELVECKVTENPRKNHVYARFSISDVDAVLIVDVYMDDALHVYQKDEKINKQYELYETTFNIMRNNNFWVVIWTIDNIECSIIVDCSEDDLYRVLKSIYEMEDIE